LAKVVVDIVKERAADNQMKAVSHSNGLNARFSWFRQCKELPSSHDRSKRLGKLALGNW
jgi:hypothetical protein